MLNAHSNLTREHIDQLRQKLAALPNRTPEEHEIELHFKELTRNRLVNNGNLETRFRLAELVIRSGARNALSGRMIGQLTERIDQLERWLEEADAAASAPTGTDLDARCLLIRGHAGTFCSGSDLAGVREALDQPSAWELAQLMQYNLARLEALPVVSVAFVEGYALGGGAELLLAADLRLISDSGRIGYVHARNGICCGWGGGARLIELAGRSTALELLASGRLVGPEEALRLGLCSARAQSVEEAVEFALKHSIESRRACRAIKRLANGSGARAPNWAAALELECQLFASTWGKEAHLRALNVNLKHQR